MENERVHGNCMSDIGCFLYSFCTSVSSEVFIIFTSLGSTSNDAVASVSNVCNEQDEKDEDDIENTEHLIHIQVTNADGIESHIEGIGLVHSIFLPNASILIV